ncbi:peptidoglycan D,D-transpeptidase FtsI family protein [Pseudalkalibacillus decolorationis]|uniref:peptidoglycan D,D-transpeptidase FtsI family protein n=1 Tax=Pseudalkalibacillus decolorationis TaxID=163879 RepID=UPI002148C005|nr:penicillin-binding protein 2 [Pseudalkalibacillus decolorationis]
MEIQKKKKSHVHFRLNILFLAVFLLFSALILRLGVVQIVHGSSFKAEAERTENITAKLDAPRGKMYDRYGRVVVDNEPVFSVTYTRSNQAEPEEIYETAEKLSKYIEKDTESLTKRDKKDFYLTFKADAEKVYRQLLTEKEREKLDDSDEYNLVIDRLNADKIALTKEEQEIAAIWRKMISGYAMTPQRIKMGATPKEIAVISEHLEEFNGAVDIKPDTTRTYPYGDTLKSIFGQVGQIPKDLVKGYVLEGRDRNDLVGTSFLEEQYESILRGTKTKIQYTTDKAGNPIDKPIKTEGERGLDVILTVDMELQQKVGEIVEKRILEARQIPANNQLKSAYVVMMNPQNGEIYSMVGKKLEDGEFRNVPFGNVYNQYPMGSTVKAATVLTGYQTGVIKPGTVLYDTPLKLPGTDVKKSYKNMGYVNDLEALQMSSNVYMFRIAMRIGGYDFNEKEGFHNPAESYRTMRYYFNQFGLGVPTGIDLPYEDDGYNGGVQALGNLMDMGIGQFDTYTPMQMAQYISTVANDGYRMQPHLLNGVRKPKAGSDQLGEIVSEFEPNVLNRIDMKQDWIERVQKGLWMVMNTKEGTAYDAFKDVEGYVAAGKTGTAEYKDSYNLTLVGYAPYDKPEVAFAVVVPFAEEGSINNLIGRDILDAYFELKEKGHTKDLLENKSSKEDLKNQE